MFVNATQVTDMALSGLEQGFTSAVSSFVDNMNRARAIRDAQLAARLEHEEITAWQKYSASLEKDLRANVDDFNNLVDKFNNLLRTCKELQSGSAQLASENSRLTEENKRLKTTINQGNAKLREFSQSSGAHLDLVGKRMFSLNNQFQSARATGYALLQLHWAYLGKVAESTGKPAESFLSKEAQGRIYQEAFQDFNRLQDVRHPVPNADGTANESFATAQKAVVFSSPMTEMLFHPWKLESSATVDETTDCKQVRLLEQELQSLETSQSERPTP